MKYHVVIEILMLKSSLVNVSRIKHTPNFVSLLVLHYHKVTRPGKQCMAGCEQPLLHLERGTEVRIKLILHNPQCYYKFMILT